MNEWTKKLLKIRRIERRDFLKMVGGITLGALVQRVWKRPAAAAGSEPNGSVRAADVVIKGLDFDGGVKEGVAVSPTGLSQNSSFPGTYLSPVLASPVPFSAIVPQWWTDSANEERLRIQLRTATTAGEWGEWTEIHKNHDWTLAEDEDVVGTMVTVPAADGTHSTFQYSVEMDGGGPQHNLQEIRFTCIDATQESPAAELAAGKSQWLAGTEATAHGYLKPPVISRASWCTDPACNSGSVAYTPVSHLIVHHTVTSNASSDWPAVVRAIWYFHTFTRGWGDIGYNYLVDMDGTIYEGHKGGDDVIGIHAAGANAGSLGLAFIGTFTNSGITPPPAMLDSAAELLAWKADQKGIDLFDAGYLPDVAWGLPYLMGHRDVYGTTSCPGDLAFGLLPWLRGEVARRVGLVSQHIHVDELSAAFSKSSANWYESPGGCGYNGHAYYTYSTTNPSESTNWGEWQLSIPQDGWYQVSVYAPFCNTGRGDTKGAKYKVTHANAVDTVVVNQNVNLGIWVSLGDFYFLKASGGKIYLSDLTTTDDGLGLWFDAIRLLPRQALPAVTVTTVQPAASSWLTTRNVNFQWSLNNPAIVSQLKLEAAVDSAFQSVVLTQSVNPNATAFGHVFGQEYTSLFWRLVVTTVQNNLLFSNVVRFGIDTLPPTSKVSAVFFEPFNSHFVLVVDGSDTGSGAAEYNIDYRAEGAVTWQNLVTRTSGKAVVFEPPLTGTVYWIRSQAIDVAGNIEAVHSSGDINTNAAIMLDEQTMMPIIINNQPKG